MSPSASKSWFMIYGYGATSATLQVPRLTVNGLRLEYRPKEKFVGVHVSSMHPNMTHDHYHEMAKKARQVGNVTFNLESHIGSLSPVNARKLYLAQMDPHLTSACEISPDVNASLLSQLEAVQEMYLRRALKLSKTASSVFLFTETGIWPLRYRRLHLVLRYLTQILSLPHDRLLYAAVSEVSRLALGDRPAGWFADVQKVYAKLVPDLPPIAPFHSLTSSMVQTASDDLRTSLLACLVTTVATSQKGYLVDRTTAVNGPHRLCCASRITCGS